MIQKNGQEIKTRFYLIAAIVLVTSWIVWSVGTVRLSHTRNFTRALHYHVLNHQIIAVYWFGQEMNNYPIHEFQLLKDFQQFLGRMHERMGNLDQLSYGLFDQNKYNKTNQILQAHYKNGSTQQYLWTLQEGIKQPFDFYDLKSLKSIKFKFSLIQFGSEHQWHIIIAVDIFSDVSMFVRMYANQNVKLADQHILTLIFGLILSALILWQFIYRPSKRFQNIHYYFLSIFLILTSILALTQIVAFQIIFIFDGITCLCAWLCSTNFYISKQKDYNISFLIGQSYQMIGRLFASFGPLLIAFSLFAYCVFCRYAAQFSSFWRTFMSLFYICYYNMTYQSAIVTARANPISLIFFIIFVLLFTICIYSGMLVSVFCSYVWGKRQQQIQKDIQNNLKIQCTECNHMYKYTERAKENPKKSINISQILQIDFTNNQQRLKYKKILSKRIQNMINKIDEYSDFISSQRKYHSRANLVINDKIKQQLSCIYKKTKQMIVKVHI